MIFPAIRDRLSGRAAMSLLRWIGIAVVAGGILAALGPFGSYANEGPLQRTGYWIASVLLALMLYGTGFRIVTRFARQGSLKWWLALIGVTLLLSVPEAFATRAAAFWLWPELRQLGPSWPLWLTQTITIGLVAMVGAALFVRRSAPGASADPVSAPFQAPTTAPLGRDVLALQMEDHYVRVHRPTGSELILMPLARAIEGMETEGLRTHRSWWVASHAVRKVEGNARSMRLHLSNGTIAPVARSAVTHLKAAGWIADGERDGFQVPAIPRR
jgi:hypothetical protein